MMSLTAAQHIIMDSKELRFLEAKTEDAIKLADLRGVPKFVGFLDEGAANVAEAMAKRLHAKYLLYGGYDEAQRVYFGVFPDWCECDCERFPITRLKISSKGTEKLTHRDILGALMSAGVERDTVGDILVGDEYSVVFAADSVARHIKAEVVKIKSSRVEITEDEDAKLPEAHRFEEKSGTVASLRLDCIVAEICNCSRQAAVELVESGFVSVCGLEVLKITAAVTKGDTVTVRRYGKFVIDNCDKVTKKGRLALNYRKYI